MKFNTRAPATVTLQLLIPLLLAAATAIEVVGQTPPAIQPATRPASQPATTPTRGGPGNPFGGPGGFGGMGMPRQEMPVLEKFDTDKNGWLNAEERKAAREYVKKNKPQGRGFGGPGGPGGGRFGPGGGGPPGMRMGREPGKPGPRVALADAKVYPATAELFEPAVLRTFFLEFENEDWEAELADFKGTDVEVTATLTVDGRKYPNVGVHFRGASSYMMVPAGLKRSLSISLDLADKKQRLYGHRTLNLLNANGDPTMLRYPLASFVGNQWLPTPRANLAKVVINGESWGIYPNVEHFDRDLINHFFAGDKKGDKEARWKVPGSPRGGGGLTYLGDDPAAYKARYEIKTRDTKEPWDALITLCRVLNQTPPDQLEKALEPIIDVDNVLRFLAFDLVIMNEDGYWIRDSDYSIYRDGKGKFHLIPHDLNETFEPMGGGGPGGGGRGGRGGFGGGPGGFGGPGGPGGEPRPTGVALDPLYGLKDPSKPLRSKLLNVPALRQRYLQYVREMALKGLDWTKLEPLARQYVALIDKEVELDTRKLAPTAAFKSGVFKSGGETPGRGMNLQAFVEQRRAYLLEHAEIKKIATTKPAGD